MKCYEDNPHVSTGNTSKEVICSDDLIDLFNRLETKSQETLPVLLLKMKSLDSSVLDVIVKTALIRSLKNPSGPYLQILNQYKMRAFIFIKEESLNEANLLPLLEIYGSLFVNFRDRTWFETMNEEKKDFLFTKLLIGLDDDSSELVVVRTFALGLVSVVGDSDSAPYLRKLLQKETWQSNVSLAREVIRRF
jgi:hypothetical protein